MGKRLKVLVLTDINVSNVHLMISEILSKITSWDVKFLNARNPQGIFDDSKWYGYSGYSDVSSTLYNKLWINRIIKIFKLIRKSDVVICTGAVSSLVKLCGKPYIYFCTGSDLDQYSKYGCNIFELYTSKVSITRKAARPIKKYLYRYAIKNANINIIAPYQFADMKLLGYKKLGFFPHPLEDEFLNISLIERLKNSNKIRKEFNCDWILFSPTRHVWRKNLEGESDFKGNDIIIKAFSFYLKQSVSKKTKLFLIEKGVDRDDSKKLVEDLGLNDFVIWLKPMNRKRLLEFYSGAHICFDEFARGCLALCAVEAMACGSPTITYIGPNNPHVPFYSMLPPIINSKDPMEIAKQISLLIESGQARKNLEFQSYEWIRKFCSHNEIRKSFIKMVEKLIGE